MIEDFNKFSPEKKSEKIIYYLTYPFFFSFSFAAPKRFKHEEGERSHVPLTIISIASETREGIYTASLASLNLDNFVANR